MTKKNLNVPGKADSLEETPFDTARREAEEEIGLPDNSNNNNNTTDPADAQQRLPAPFQVEHLCELPASFSKSELVVRPCVALLHAYDSKTGEDADPEVTLIPRLDPREVAAVFTVSLRNLLSSSDLSNPDGDPNEWYRGAWTKFIGYPWRSKSSTLSSRPSETLLRNPFFFFLFLFIYFFYCPGQIRLSTNVGSEMHLHCSEKLTGQ